MKRTVSLILCAISLVLLCSCSGSTATLDGSMAEIVAKAEKAADFSSVTFTYLADDYSDEVLMFTYGLEDETLYNTVEDFVLSSRSGMFAATFSVIRFANGTSNADIESIKQIITDAYVAPLIGALRPYDPEQTAIAEKYQFKIYGNTLVLVISDKADEVFKAIEGK